MNTQKWLAAAALGVLLGCAPPPSDSASDASASTIDQVPLATQSYERVQVSDFRNAIGFGLGDMVDAAMGSRGASRRCEQYEGRRVIAEFALHDPISQMNASSPVLPAQSAWMFNPYERSLMVSVESAPALLDDVRARCPMGHICNYTISGTVVRDGPGSASNIPCVLVAERFRFHSHMDKNAAAAINGAGMALQQFVEGELQSAVTGEP